MSKYKAGNYIQISRRAFEKLEGCKTSAKWLYTVLNELEHRFTSGSSEQAFFFRGVDDLAIDTGLSRPVVIQGLRELAEFGLIKTWQAHFKGKSGKKSERHITAIEVLDI